MPKVNVICGGQSSEREVSLRSGRAVTEALRAANYEVKVLDTTDSDINIKDCDVVFPVLHGVGGEDGTIQARLETLGSRFVGTDSAGSRLCMDKAAYSKKMTSLGFLMPKGDLASGETYRANPLSKAPHILKPIDGGSTIDTYIVRRASDVDLARVEEYFSRHPQMIIEELIVGDEITVGILGDRSLPVIEIIPPANEEFDYENKYNGKTQELCPPEHVSNSLQQKAQKLAERIHRAAGCRDMSRSDFIINTSGQIYLLETNTIPGMTNQSLYPKMAATAGISFPELCNQLVQMALSR